jgi:predicted NAD-dependent protein-ADP-ribosyltransferase YbiA (DUF1768 family)
MSVIGPFRGEYYCFTSYFRTPIEYTLPTNGYRGVFNTLEHVVQAAKCPSASQAIAFLRAYGFDPRAAHKYGQTLAQIHPQFEARLIPMLEDINILKFHRNAATVERLMKTGTDYLIYYNYWHDTTLGVCACKRCNNTGRNLLGAILMGIRNSISEFRSNSPYAVPFVIPNPPVLDPMDVPF